jgi:virginiamycin B lyase
VNRKFLVAAFPAALLLAGCALSNGNAVPQGSHIALSRTALLPDKRGKITIFDDPFADPTPFGITAGPDGAIWFTDPGNDVIGRITTDGNYTLQQSAGVELSSGITVGPDNNLWFTVAQDNAMIGRITPSGTVTLFQDPGGSFPLGITTGPDGALWFGESNGTVGRMTTKGKVKHFTLGGTYTEYEGIVTGPDKNLWVTEFANGTRTSTRVIRLSPGGKSKAFKVAPGPDLICVGPDNALWFTEGNAIGRLTTSGKYKEFPIEVKYAQAGGIATGPDGAIWFTDFAERFGIGRMTTKGKMQFFKPPASELGEYAEITAGPDGAMWFTSYLAPEAVGRITVH